MAVLSRLQSVLSEGSPKTVAGRVVRGGLRRVGFDLVRTGPRPWPIDFDDEMIATCEAVRPYTLTSTDRIAALVHSIAHVADRGIPGAVVECGVWRGGSMMAAARTLVSHGDLDRDLWLYDTFDRMPDPGEHDFTFDGVHASKLFEGDVDPHDTDGYRYLPMDAVRDLLTATGYPGERLHFVPGMIEETIPGEVPDEIAVLRLDTDWYESTKHEMEHLFPRIVDGGVLIIDDYGHFTGSRRAVDEYFAGLESPPMLQRIDWTARLAVISR